MMDLQTTQSAELASDSQALRAIEALNAKPTSKRISGKADRRQQLNQLIESEWIELPYAMMQLTAAGVSRPGKRFYWRDHDVHLGEIKLHLTTIPRVNDDAGYTATYSIEEECRVFHMRPTLERNMLHWSIPGICNEENLTSQQLAEKLLSKLVTFYSTGLRGSPRA